MKEKQFLETLSNIKLDENIVFVEKKIKDIEKSPCKKSNTLVFDFDKAKEIIVNKYKIHNHSSCDALKILIDDKRIDFIEFKSIKDILEKDRSNIRDIDKLKEKIIDFDLKNKIKDSHFLIRHIVADKNLSFKGNDRKTYDSINKNFIIVFDVNQISSLEIINISFSIMAIQRTITNTIKEEVKSAELFNISAPIIKNCETIDTFYN